MSDRRHRVLPLLLAALAASPACSLAGLEERELPYSRNTCENQGDCPESTTCQSTANSSRCVSTIGSFLTLLFRVSPAVSASNLTGQELFQLATDVPAVSNRYDLELSDLTELSGAVTATIPAGCGPAWGLPASGSGGSSGSGGADGGTAGSASGGTNTNSGNAGTTGGGSAERSRIEARVTFVPSERRWGLTTESHVTQTTRTSAFRALLSAGSYDVYIEPKSAPSNPGEAGANDCSLTPRLLRATKLSSGNTSLMLELPQPTRLQLEIRVMGTDSLEGFSVDLLEPYSGRVVSTRRQLSAPTRTEGGVRVYTVQVNYSPTANLSSEVVKSEVVRLSPPTGVTAPALYFERTALELFTKGSATIELATSLPNTLSFEGQVTDTQNRPQVSAVSLVATSLDRLPAGTLGGFVRTMKTDDQGRFRAELLPGTYQVTASPVSSRASAPLATRRETWVIAGKPVQQAGQTIVLRPAPRVRGRLLLPDRDQGAAGVTLTAEASPLSLSPTVLERELGQIPAVPSILSSVVTPPDGAFELFAESGSYDFSARPPDGAGFPWLVLPGLQIPDGQSEVVLEDLHLPWPVPLEINTSLKGREDSAALLLGAHVQAYALLDVQGRPTADPALAEVAVPVADARVDERGIATLLLPARLNDPLATP